jgi:hypothetical protein
MQNFLEILESRGFFGRNPGDTYMNSDTGDVLVFAGIRAFPEPRIGQFKKLGQLEQAIQQFEEQTGGTIQWVNRPTSQHKAFAVVELTDLQGQPVYWGRYFNAITGVMTGKWDNDQVPAGWEWQSKAREKQKSGLKPSDLIKDGKLFGGPGEVIDQVAKFLVGKEDAEVLINGLRQSAAGELAVFPGLGSKMPAIRDYFGEIMAPLYIMSNQLGGPAEDARRALLKDQKWSECGVRWPMSQTEGLVDSYLVAPDKSSVGISSKGAQGAKASIKNLMDGARRMKEKDPEGYQKIKNTADMLIGLQSSGIMNALTLAIKNEIMSEDAAQEVLDLIKKGKKQFRGISDELKDLMAQRPDKVMRMKESVSNPLFNTGFAILSIIADMVADHVNENTSFPKDSVDILNASAMMQVYCDMTVKGSDAVVTGFRSLYPPRFQGRVLLSSGKSFMSTGNKGNFTFAFKAD